MISWTTADLQCKGTIYGSWNELHHRVNYNPSLIYITFDFNELVDYNDPEWAMYTNL